MHHFDALCFKPVQPLTAEDIKQLRLREQASQAVFAHYLNTIVSTIKQWESGEKKPSGAALK